MSFAIRTVRGGICGLCHEEFSASDEQYTHVGGERHDGFHKICFINCLNAKAVCPWDGMAVDPTSLTSRTERIMQRLKAAYEDANVAATVGIRTGLFGAVMNVVITAQGNLKDQTLLAVIASGATGLLNIASELIENGEAGDGVVAGTLLGAGVGLMDIAATTRLGAVDVMIASGLVMTILGEALISLRRPFLDPIEPHRFRRNQNIHIGLYMGALGAAITGFPLPIALVTISLVGGTVAGCLSLFRS